jgi:hypothetical protein
MTYEVSANTVPSVTQGPRQAEARHLVPSVGRLIGTQPIHRHVPHGCETAGGASAVVPSLLLTFCVGLAGTPPTSYLVMAPQSSPCVACTRVQEEREHAGVP